MLNVEVGRPCALSVLSSSWFSIFVGSGDSTALVMVWLRELWLFSSFLAGLLSTPRVEAFTMLSKTRYFLILS